MSLIYVDDVGAIVTIDLKVTNIPGTTVVSVIVENPLGATSAWVLEGGELNRTTGIITHSTKAGELPAEGEYKVQVWKTDTNLNIHSTIDYFKAYRRLIYVSP
jgi:hypothetical protein